MSRERVQLPPPTLATVSRAMTPSLFDLSGRTAVVVGGTSGIGRALALGLADAGADVVATGRRADAVDAVAADIEQRGRRTLRHPVDVTSLSSLQALCDACLDRIRPCGRRRRSGGRHETHADARDERRRLEPHSRYEVTGMFRTYKVFAPSMIARGIGPADRHRIDCLVRRLAGSERRTRRARPPSPD